MEIIRNKDIGGRYRKMKCVECGRNIIEEEDLRTIRFPGAGICLCPEHMKILKGLLNQEEA